MLIHFGLLHSLGDLHPFNILCVPFLSLIIILLMKSAWSKIISNCSSFFWLVLKKYDFIHLFTFNLYVFLYLKYISYRKPVVRHGFLMNSHNLCIFIVFKTFTVKIINIELLNAKILSKKFITYPSNIRTNIYPIP